MKNIVLLWIILPSIIISSDKITKENTSLWEKIKNIFSKNKKENKIKKIERNKLKGTSHKKYLIAAIGGALALAGGYALLGKNEVTEERIQNNNISIPAHSESPESTDGGTSDKKANELIFKNLGIAIGAAGIGIAGGLTRKNWQNNINKVKKSKIKKGEENQSLVKNDLQLEKLKHTEHKIKEITDTLAKEKVVSPHTIQQLYQLYQYR